MNDHRISVRLSRPDELDWINARYNAIGFKRSIDSDLIAIAEVDGEPVGQGRVQHISAGVGELGGMFVDEAFRGLGLAGRIIEFLLQASRQYHTLYCLPYAHLAGLYASFGFAVVSSTSDVPAVVRDKHRWCNQVYEHETLLTVRHRGVARSPL